MIKYMKLCKLASICFCFILGAALASEETRTVVDGRGASVQVPARSIEWGPSAMDWWRK
jgi:hypothetical protein